MSLCQRLYFFLTNEVNTEYILFHSGMDNTQQYQPFTVSVDCHLNSFVVLPVQYVYPVGSCAVKAHNIRGGEVDIRL